jgi:hypothetical protein
MGTNKKLWEVYPEIWKTESSFMSWLRGGIRRIWAKHPVKLDFIKQSRVKIPNPNPRGKVKEVWGGKCALTGEYFVLNELECDHKVGNNSLKSVEDIQSFVEGVLLVTADDLQLVSKEAHKIKSYAEKQGISFEEAKIEKEVIEIIKQKKDKAYLQEHHLPVSSTQALRRKTIVAHKLSLLKEKQIE